LQNEGKDKNIIFLFKSKLLFAINPVEESGINDFCRRNWEDIILIKITLKGYRQNYYKDWKNYRRNASH
jgi:hypothetical protein